MGVWLRDKIWEGPGYEGRYKPWGGGGGGAVPNYKRVPYILQCCENHTPVYITLLL